MNIEIFRNEKFGEVRAIMMDEESWLVGKDVAAALGYTNPTKAIRDHVDPEDKIVGVQNVTPSIVDAIGREQFHTWINESGVYALIFSSRLKEAIEFKHWVTSEVLPSIRKHGAYVTPETLENLISDPEFGIRLFLQKMRRLLLERKGWRCA